MITSCQRAHHAIHGIVVEDAALAGLNPDLPAEALDDLYQVTFAALRDTLLPKLISGKLRVKDAERVVKEAV